MKDAGLPALLVSVRHRFYLFICAFAAILFFGEVWVCEFPKNFFHVDVPVLRRDYFFINRRIFKLDLTSAQTRMYLFFCKCSESRSKRFWNSYNDILSFTQIKAFCGNQNDFRASNSRLNKKIQNQKKRRQLQR